jgi:phage shock protein A
MDELIESGTLDDFTTDKTALDRELEALTSASQVDAELARLKGELGTGAKQKELEQ